MIPLLLLLASAGLIVFSDETVTTKTKPKQSDKFYVYIRADEFGKGTMYFDSYDDAKKFYDQLVKEESISYQEILDNSPTEKQRYKENKAKGWTKEEEGQEQPSDVFKLQEVYFGKGDEEFEMKEF